MQQIRADGNAFNKQYIGRIDLMTEYSCAASYIVVIS